MMRNSLSVAERVSVLLQIVLESISMKKAITILLAMFLTSVCLSKARGAQGPYQTETWVGTNYTPAYCVNQVQMWHEFRPEVIERELVAARRYYGLTTLRVYLHNLVFDAEKELLFERMDRFLGICDRNGIRPGFTFFDDCHRHEGITLESLPPVKGYHNGRWAACPQDRERTEDNFPKFERYVKETIGRFRDDPRVLWWETFNEPNLARADTQKILKLAREAAEAAEPTQPIICCWEDNEYTDIVNVHNYTANFSAWAKKTEMNLQKGCVFTEAGARWYAPRTSSGEPVEIIDWLSQRKQSGRYVPGVYLCWELFVGNSNCRWYWGTPEGAPEPTVPWCGLMWPDGTPVSWAEAEAIYHYTTGKSRALFFDDFQKIDYQERMYPGWDLFNAAKNSNDSRVLKLDANMKMITGDPAWDNYLLEAVVMLKESNGNAGLLFRVQDAQDGKDNLHGYYVGFDSKILYFGKFDKGWKELERFDLGTLDCQVKPDVWNLMRIEAKGNRFKIYFNRMHPVSDENNGLRIDYTDTDHPIPRGKIGVRTHNLDAWFDNVVVMPLED